MTTSEQRDERRRSPAAHLRTAGAVAMALAALAAAGCGSSGDTSSKTTTASDVPARTVDDQQVEQGIKDDLSTSTVDVTKVSCPSDVPVQKGDTFTCSVTFSNEASGKVTVTQQGANKYTYTLKSGSVEIPGSEVESQIEKQLAAEGAPDATATCPQTIVVKVGTTVTCDLSGAQGAAAGTVTFTFSSEDGSVDPSSVQTG